MKIIFNHKFNFFQPKSIAQMCRLGSNADGGYVLPNFILENCDSLLTLGLGENWSFEIDLINKKKLNKIIIYDHTVGFGKFVKRVIDSILRRLLFIKCKRGGVIDRIKILHSYNSLVQNLFVIHHRIKIDTTTNQSKSISFNDAFKDFQNLNPIVKIDIEGGEWTVIDQIISKAEFINCLIMEIHVFNDWSDWHIEKLKLLFDKMIIVHLHPNNYSTLDIHGIPKGLEITLIHNRYSSQINGLRYKLPLELLDFPCNRCIQEYKIVFDDSTEFTRIE
jgi:hypothetical protein